MNAKQFDEVVENRIKLIRSVLASKRKEYAAGGNRLHNFDRASSMLNCSRQHALVGMLSKHLVSILDIVDNFNVSAPPSVALIEEKCGDAINYLILLEAMLKEDSGRA